MLNYCPIPGASQPRGMRFYTENSRCIPSERITPDEFSEYIVGKRSECETRLLDVWGK